jgi:hypothetical protein
MVNGESMLSIVKKGFLSSGLLLLLLVAIAPASSRPTEVSNTCSGEEDQQCQATIHQDIPCGVYMAPSTIGQANMGVYTGNDLPADVAINFPEIVVPLMFRDWGNHGDNPDGSLWDRYIWEGPVAEIESYQDEDRDASKPIFVPGVGCTVNSMLEMNNIVSTHGSMYDTAGLHRSRDPGAGAFTPYHSSKTVTTEPVRGCYNQNSCSELSLPRSSFFFCCSHVCFRLVALDRFLREQSCLQVTATTGFHGFPEQSLR